MIMSKYEIATGVVHSVSADLQKIITADGAVTAK
jgi:hypothetical protein